MKALARQTVGASEDIARRIQAVQNEVASAAVVIREVAQVVERINGIQGGIAAAVEEQSATTQEMGRQMTHAAEGCRQISQESKQVDAAMVATADSVDQVRELARRLAALAQELERLCETTAG